MDAEFELVSKFDDYYYYAIDRKGLEPGSTKKQCSLDVPCAQDGKAPRCCVNAVVSNESKGTR